jgi:hypothetical protein
MLHDAKEARLVEEAGMRKLKETVGALRSPGAMHLDYDRPLAGV